MLPISSSGCSKEGSDSLYVIISSGVTAWELRGGAWWLLFVYLLIELQPVIIHSPSPFSCWYPGVKTEGNSQCIHLWLNMSFRKWAVRPLFFVLSVTVHGTRLLYLSFHITSLYNKILAVVPLYRSQRKNDKRYCSVAFWCGSKYFTCHKRVTGCGRVGVVLKATFPPEFLV